MSRLSVYWPDECHTISKASHDHAVILRFPTVASAAPSQPLDIISRARLIFENRRCCQCGYPVVKPVELDDAMTNTSGLEIPGSATLVGFECTSCEATWSI